MNRGFFAIRLIIILPGIAACGGITTPSPPEMVPATSAPTSIQEPTWTGQAQPTLETDEARIRCIIADIQLGGVADYYRQFAEDDAVVAEAVRQWDAGVRLATPGQFERKIVGGTWKVVYAGTETPIDCMDVVLIEPASSYCGNSYWPIVEGAQWVYSVEERSSAWETPTYTETWTITEVSGDLQNAAFTVHVETSGRLDPVNPLEISRDDSYTCSAEGISQVLPTLTQLILFPESELVAGTQWSAPGVMVTVQFFSSRGVPVGEFQIVSITTDFGGAQQVIEYSPQVGPVWINSYIDLGGAWHTMELSLVGYSGLSD